MKNNLIQTNLINFIKEYSAVSSLYWVPLVRLKKDLPTASYLVHEIYENNAIVSLENVFKICGSTDVHMFQMDHGEYFKYDSILDLLYEKDEDGYCFPWYVETFYFDSAKKWLVYVSHEGTISFTGKAIAEAAVKSIDQAYRIH